MTTLTLIQRAMNATLAVVLLAVPTLAGPPGISLVGSPVAGPAPVAPMVPVFAEVASREGPGTPSVVRFDLGALIEQLSLAAGPLVLDNVPVSDGELLTLEVERFYVTKPWTVFEIGNESGPGVPMEFDPDEVVLLRGRVAGCCESFVFIGISPWSSNGIIDAGPGRGMYGISSRGKGGAPLPAGQMRIFRGGLSGQHDMPMCEVDEEPTFRPVPTPFPGGYQELGLTKFMRQIEVAVETDHEFYQIFNDAPATAAYLVQMYGACSAIMMRDFNCRLDLVFARVWETPTEPFQADLGAFLDYWQANMGAVKRDNAQMFSGRADKPGGVAYLNSMCNGNAYSFCGNAVGFFADPNTSSVWGYDPLVAAHELGHNFGSKHDHDYGIDNCGSVNVVPRRGTIMGYCNQTVSGGMAVEDLRFHVISQDNMIAYIQTKTLPACVVYDCNQNGISDALDILIGGGSNDANANGIPDECEDCNANGTLDTIDIALGVSKDLNNNTVPDECEPDCNGNKVPDALDIASGLSKDLHGDRVPDECDVDCDADGVSDYNEIMLDMTLDKDRDRALDACQDCDQDGTPDLVELEGSRDVWLASVASGVTQIREYHSVTGVHIKASTPGLLNNAQDVRITPDRRVLVASAGNHKVVEFDRLGAFVKDLVPAGSGSLVFPSALELSPTGTLLVASRENHRVNEYHLSTGAFIKTLVPQGSGSLSLPYGLAIGPDGLLYVSSFGNHRVNRYNASTGAFVGTFVTPGSGGLVGPRGLVFKPTDGNLLVAAYGQGQVNQYHAVTGAFINNWALTVPKFINQPWGLRIGLDGHVYVSVNSLIETHVSQPRISIFHIDTGNWLRSHVQATDSLITLPSGFDFMPDVGTDCNANLTPDGCDIASGVSKDQNNNGIPDECEGLCDADCDADGSLTIDDFICFQTLFAIGAGAADCDGDASLTIDDFICFQTLFAIGC
jgi:DNA-binding beta-propeller fold protein YncE